MNLERRLWFWDTEEGKNRHIGLRFCLVLVPTRSWSVKSVWFFLLSFGPKAIMWSDKIHYFFNLATNHQLKHKLILPPPFPQISSKLLICFAHWFNPAKNWRKSQIKSDVFQIKNTLKRIDEKRNNARMCLSSYSFPQKKLDMHSMWIHNARNKNSVRVWFLLYYLKYQTRLHPAAM